MIQPVRLQQILPLFALIFFISSSPLAAVSLTFSVDMAYQIELGHFDPNADFVDVAGNFNGWGGTLAVLDDPDQDSIYSGTFSGFPSGSTIQFKFRMNGAWDGTEEFPGGGPNRSYTVSNASDSLYYWYNDDEIPSGPPVAQFSVVSSTVQEGAAILFQNASSGIVNAWEWTFPGGSPAASTDEHPTVFYAQPGSFDVQLIARNDSLSDTLWLPGFITVQARDRSQLAWWNETVFYEIFVRSFYDSDGDGIGDFRGLTQQLDYLNDGDSTTTDDLGIEGIWLMPINPSPSYHGYDVTDYRGINPDFGSLQDFRDFLDAAHARGIKVIMDYVVNHSSSQHPWFIDAQNNANGRRDYYRWATSHPGYNGPWGQNVWHGSGNEFFYGVFWGGMPDLNYDTPAVRDSIWEAATFWLDDVGVDGFRLDAIKFIYENGSDLENLPATYQFWKDFEGHTEQVAPHSLNVGEAWTNTGTVINYVQQGGLDFCFEFDLAESIVGAAQSGDVRGLRSQMDAVYGVYPHLQWGSFLTNHDINRVFSVLGQDIGKNKTAAAALLTLPGVPFLYYGEEIGMVGTKPDEHIRRPMQWTAGTQGGFTTGSPWIGLNGNYQQYNVATAEADSASLLHHYRKLIHLREAMPSLQTGDYQGVGSADDAIFAFWRMAEGDTSLVVVHTGAGFRDSVALDLTGSPFGNGSYRWEDRFQSALDTLLVTGSQTLWLTEVEGQSVRVYQATGGQPVGQVKPTAPAAHLAIFPNPTAQELHFRFSEQPKGPFGLEIWNLNGERIRHFPALPLDTHSISVAELPAGTYLLVVEHHSRTVVRKFIKQ